MYDISKYSTQNLFLHKSSPYIKYLWFKSLQTILPAGPLNVSFESHNILEISFREWPQFQN